MGTKRLALAAALLAASAITAAIGSCGGTRTALGNWATQMTRLTTP
jgi:hypothetical protein